MQGEHTTVRSFVCAEEIPGRRFVTLDATTGQASVCGAGEPADGVSVDTGREGGPVSVALNGPAYIEFAEEVLPGQRVESDEDGKAVVLDEGADNGLCLTKGLNTADGVDRAEIMVGVFDRS